MTAGTHIPGPRRAAHLLCACLTILLCCADPARDANAASARAATATPPPARKLDAVEERIRTAEKWIRDARRTESQSTSQLRDAETRLGAARAELMRLREAQAGLRKETERLDGVIAAGEARRRELAAQAGAHLRTLQRSGGGDPLRAMLSAQDPTAAPRLLAYYGYVSRARLQVTERMRENARTLLANRAQLAQQQVAIARQEAAVQEETQRIAALQGERMAAIQQVRREIGDRAAELKKLQAERSALRRLIESLAQRQQQAPARPREQERPARPGATPARPRNASPAPTGSTLATLAADTAFARTRGQLPWPVQGMVEANYGSTKGNTSMRWEGMLISANVGAEVRAVHAGEVAFAGWLRSLGNILIVDHGGGYMSLYAHLDSLARRTGERITPGTSVGRVGTSGGRETPALYFELRLRGNPIDPRSWLSRR